MHKLLLAVCLFAFSGATQAGDYPPKPHPKPKPPTTVNNVTNHNKTVHTNRSNSTSQGGTAASTSQGGAGGAATSMSSAGSASSTSSGQGGSVQNQNEGDEHRVIVAPGLALAGSGDCVESFSLSVLFAGVARSYRCPMKDMEDALAAYITHGKSKDDQVQYMLRRMRDHAFGSDLPAETQRDAGGEMN
jgi:hypothetical protein